MARKIKTVSFVLFHLKMSFSADIANNLIEKHETSAATAIINPTIAFLVEEDRQRLPKNGGVKKVGINHISCGGGTTM
jgi:hypothetical protein